MSPILSLLWKDGWRKISGLFDGGDRYFQANSHAQGLTGSGPWGAFEPRFYFTKYPDGLEGDPARGWGSVRKLVQL